MPNTPPSDPVRLTRRKFISSTGLATLGAGCLLSSGAVSGTETSDPAGSDCEQKIKDALEKERADAFEAQIASQAYLLKPLVAHYGEEALDILRNQTVEQARAQFTQGHFEKRDLTAVKSLLWDQLDQKKFAIEKREDRPNKLSYRVTRCPYADAWKKSGAGDIGFVTACCWDYGFCKGLNPDIQFSRTQTLMQGDACCDHTYTLEAS